MTPLDIPSRRRLHAHADTPPTGIDAVEERLGELAEEVRAQSVETAQTAVRVDALASEIRGQREVLDKIREGIDAMNARGARREKTEDDERTAASVLRTRIYRALSSTPGLLAILAVAWWIGERLGIPLPAMPVAAQAPVPVIQISSESTPSLDERDQQPHGMPPQEPSPSPGALGE